MKGFNDILKHLGLSTSSHFLLIAGPCAVESEDLCMQIAETVSGLCRDRNIAFIFKASYRKANRSRIDAFTGIGDEAGLTVLGNIKDHFGIPVTTDIHGAGEADVAAQFVDMLQIPAFLCRQTDLLLAAGKTGKAVNVKKGQFLSHHAMQFAVEKVCSTGNENILITERGNSFGYQDLVVDFVGVKEMLDVAPGVILDCTHALQKPNQPEGVTGGKPQYIETLAKCGLVTGVHGLFLETHPNPDKALSDGANMLPLNQLEKLLDDLVLLKSAIKP